MGSQYFLKIDGPQRVEAFTFGSFDVINYVAKDAMKAMADDKNYIVTLLELKSASVVGYIDPEEGEPGETAVSRDVTRFTGDGDTAALVLKRRLAAEKKQQNDAGQANDGTNGPDESDMLGEQRAAEQ